MSYLIVSLLFGLAGMVLLLEGDLPLLDKIYLVLFISLFWPFVLLSALLVYVISQYYDYMNR